MVMSAPRIPLSNETTCKFRTEAKAQMYASVQVFVIGVPPWVSFRHISSRPSSPLMNGVFQKHVDGMNTAGCHNTCQEQNSRMQQSPDVSIRFIKSRSEER